MKIFWSVVLVGLADAKLSFKDVRNAFQKTKQGISRYLTDVFDKEGDMTSDFDDFTRFGAKLEPQFGGGGEVSKIREKFYPEIISLFKKLNIRSLFNSMGNNMMDRGFDETRYGLFADAIKDYGCWCLPNQGSPGHGAPVDDIDRICHEFNTCKTCLEYDACLVDETVYEWQIISEDGNNNLFCTDANGSCQRNLCHCEVNLAQQILDIAHTYNPIYSHANGFDRSKHCGKHAVPLFTTTTSTTTTTTVPTTTMMETETTSTWIPVARSTSSREQTTEENVFSSDDEYEAETDDDQPVISEDALVKILVADYPEDPLLSTNYPTFTTTTERVQKYVQPVRLALPAKLEVPVMLKSAVQPRKPPTPKCCGDYPNVHIFNPERRKCCDGVLRSIGSC